MQAHRVLRLAGMISVSFWGAGAPNDLRGTFKAFARPDADTAWRALSSTGAAVPSLRHSGPDVVRAAVLEAVEHCRDRHGGYRFRGDHQFVIARKIVA